MASSCLKTFSDLETTSFILLIQVSCNFDKLDFISFNSLEPSLTDQQLESLAYEVERVEKVFKTLMLEQPLDFALSIVKESPEAKTGPK